MNDNHINIVVLVLEGNTTGIAFVPALFKQIKGFSLPPLVKLNEPEIRTYLNLTTLKNSIKKSATEQFLTITKDVIEEYREV